MSKALYGFIIKGTNVLTVQSNSQFKGRLSSFPCLPMAGQGDEQASLANILADQLQLDQPAAFGFEVQQSSHKGFLIDLDSENSLSWQPPDAAELQWVNLMDRQHFSEFDHYVIRGLIEHAVKAGYQAAWIEAAKSVYFPNKGRREILEKLSIRREERLKDLNFSPAYKGTALLVSLAIGILFDYFFTQDALGISVPLWNLLALLGVLWFFKDRVSIHKGISLIFLVPLVLLSSTFAIYNDSFLRFFNSLALPFLMAGYVLCIRYQGIDEINLSLLPNLLNRVFLKPFAGMPKAFIFGKEILAKPGKKQEHPLRKSILMGIMIALPLLAIILSLLASAEMMFDFYVRQFFDGFHPDNWLISLDNFLIPLIVGLYFFGMLWSFQYDGLPHQAIEGTEQKKIFDPITVITLLALVNLVYLFFTVIQFSYLYGGGPLTFSYAAYARKGFFELVLVTLINFGILSLCIPFTKEGLHKINLAVKFSYSLLILFSFNMLISANYKMGLYENAFGFTRLRIFVRAFMLLIGILLVLVLLGIWVKKIPVLRYGFIAMLVVYVGLNFLNVDLLIARENINRFEITQEIDIHYLSRLSLDAAPEMLRLLESEDNREVAALYFYGHHNTLNRNYDRWFEYNYGKNQFLKLDTSPVWQTLDELGLPYELTN